MFQRIAKTIGILLLAVACNNSDVATSAGPRVAASRFVSPTEFSRANYASTDLWIDAINASCASEIRGYIPAGTYEGASVGHAFDPSGNGCNQTLNVEIVGAGSSLSHIDQSLNSSSNDSATAFLVRAGAYVTFDSLDLVGSALNTEENGNYNIGIKFEHAEGGTVKNSTFSGWATAAVTVQDTPNDTIRDNTINCANSSNQRGSGSAGIWFGNAAVALTGATHGPSLYGYIRDNHISNCAYESIHLEGVSNSQITLNTIACPLGGCNVAIVMTGRQFGNDAGSYACRPSPASNNIVESNQIHGGSSLGSRAFQYGILMMGNGPAAHDSIRINTVDSVSVHGIAVAADRQVWYAGTCAPLDSFGYAPQLHVSNVIKDNYIHYSGQSGVWAGGDSTTIHNNQVYYSGSHGIVHGATYGLLSANDSEYNGGDGMHLCLINNGSITGGYRILSSISNNTLKNNTGWGLAYRSTDSNPASQWFQNNGSGSYHQITSSC
jgi:hypothetical protein